VASSQEPAAHDASHCHPSEPTKSTEKSTKVEPITRTPEEQAAGRAEAVTALAYSGAIGQLQETRAPRSANPPQDSDAKTEESEESEEVEETTGEESTLKAAKTKESSGEGSTVTTATGANELTEEEKKQVEKLKARDREVRSHEAAHQAAAGGLASSPTYIYETGPDGKKYAVGGEVSVKSGGSDDPEQALRDAEAIKKAAEAPANPSSQDRAVAAAASADINRLRSLNNERKEEEQKTDNNADASSQDATKPPTDQGLGNYNGLSLGQKVVRAYEAVKNSFGSYNSRSSLATI
jgi:hypothetical protein